MGEAYSRPALLLPSRTPVAHPVPQTAFINSRNRTRSQASSDHWHTSLQRPPAQLQTFSTNAPAARGRQSHKFQADRRHDRARLDIELTDAETEQRNVLADLAQTQAGAGLDMGLLVDATRSLQERLMTGVESEAAQQSRRLRPSKGEAEKLMSAGLMLEGLQCFESGQQLGDTIWTFTLPAPRGASLRTQPLGRHSLTEGTYAAVLSVVHGRQSSPAEMTGAAAWQDLMTFGTVTEASSNSLKIAFSKPMSDRLDVHPRGRRVRVVATLSETTSDRQFAAIEQLGQLPQINPSHLNKTAPRTDLNVRLALLGDPNIHFHSMKNPIWSLELEEGG
ncbi:hypothetical protein WJX84_009172 [Apatococcus fuscideae]|uniref:Uncharacterized protein n=1 Tax=Apatococcus fuscideae TaxID=2026836 RepID=A0AAW1TBC9_9CHLO